MTSRQGRQSKAPAAAEGWFPAQLEALLSGESSWLDMWRRLSRDSGFPRPPTQVPLVHRGELLRRLPSMLEEESYLGHSLPTSKAFGRLSRNGSGSGDVAIGALSVGQLQAQLVRLCLSKAELQALRNPVEAQGLVELARLLAMVLDEEEDATGIDDLCAAVETSTVRAEVESVAGMLAALVGNEVSARRLLQVGSAILETPNRLHSWGRARSGRLRRREVPRFDLRGHARWLGCASRVEASLGELVAARSLAQDAEELYLQARDYFSAGMQAYQLARLAAWQAQPERAAEELERGLQLLDLRTMPRLRRRLLVELSFFYLDAGAVVRGSEEMELARGLDARVSDLHAVRGLLFAKTGELCEGVRWLRKAREEAGEQIGTEARRSRQILTLDLVEAELCLPFPRQDPARWLEDEVSRAGLRRRPRELHERWQQLVAQVRANSVDPASLSQLRADLQRAETFAHREWVAARPVLLSG